MRKALRAESARCLQVFGTLRALPTVLLVHQQGNPRPRFHLQQTLLYSLLSAFILIFFHTDGLT